MADEQITYEVKEVSADGNTLTVRYSVGSVFIDVSMSKPGKGVDIAKYVDTFAPRAALMAVLHPSDSPVVVGVTGSIPLIAPATGDPIGTSPPPPPPSS